MDTLTAGDWGCTAFVKQNAVQIRAEIVPLMADDLVVVEFDLEVEAITVFFVADLALFRIRIGGQPFHLRFDQASELRTGDHVVRFEPLVLLVAVKPNGFRLAERGVDSDADAAHPLLAPALDVLTQRLASAVD